MRKILLAVLSTTLIILLNGCAENRQVTFIEKENTSITKAVGREKSESTVIKDKAVLPDPKTIKYVINPQFDFCSDPIDGIMRCEKGTGDTVRYGFIDRTGNIISDAVYEDTKFYIGASSASCGFAEGLAPVKKHEKWGYIDLSGKEKIGFRYDDATLFSEGLAQIALNNKYGYINKKGELVIKPIFDSGSEFHNGVAVVQINTKYGFINKEGKWIVKPQYDAIDFGRWDYYWTHSNILQIDINGLKGIAKITSGKVEIVLVPKYSKLYPFVNGEAKFTLARKNSKGEFIADTTEEGFINEAGKEICRWKSIDGTDYQYMSDGLRLAQNKDGKWGFTDKSLKMLIPYQYSDAGAFIDGWSIIGLNGKMGLIDKEGNELLQPKYDVVIPHKSEGYIIVKENNQKYLISTRTFDVISKKYDEIADGNTLLPIYKGNKIGFMDNEGRELAAPQFDEYNFSFVDDYVWVKKNNRWIYVDKAGVKRFPDAYEEVSLFMDGLACVQSNGKWGVIDLYGNIKVPFTFDKAFVAGEKLIKLLIEGKYGFIKVE